MRSSLLDDARVVAVPFVVARLLVGLAWLLARAVADRFYAAHPAQLGEGLLAWDGTWYRDIADLGYHALPAEGLRFYPTFPLLGRALSAPFGAGSSLVLVLVANVAAFALAVLIRRLVLAEGRGVAVADRAVWIVTLFPPAFVFVWAYAESLMLVAAVGAFLNVRKGRWWCAAACGLLAGATRPVGIAVVAAMAVEACRDWRSVRAPQWVARAAAVVAPIVGAVGFLVWVRSSYGDALLPFRVQSSLRGESDPFTRLLSGVKDMFGVERFGDGLHVPFAIAFIVLLVLTYRRLPVSYGAYATVVLLLALSANNLNSVERYALNAFPLLITLAVLLRTERAERIGLAICGCGLLSLCTLAWLAVYVP